MRMYRGAEAAAAAAVVGLPLDKVARSVLAAGSAGSAGSVAGSVGSGTAFGSVPSTAGAQFKGGGNETGCISSRDPRVRGIALIQRQPSPPLGPVNPPRPAMCPGPPAITAAILPLILAAAGASPGSRSSTCAATMSLPRH